MSLFLLQSLQMVSGLLSIGVGIVFAATQEIHESLFSLFRVSQLSGSLVRLCSNRKLRTK